MSGDSIQAKMGVGACVCVCVLHANKLYWKACVFYANRKLCLKAYISLGLLC